MKHNIAEFIGTISDGGAETLVKDYAFLLDKDIFNVFVIVFRRTRNAANDALLAQANVEIIEIYKRNDFMNDLEIENVTKSKVKVELWKYKNPVKCRDWSFQETHNE